MALVCRRVRNCLQMKRPAKMLKFRAYAAAAVQVMVSGGFCEAGS
jgi:hypothetical protein